MEPTNNPIPNPTPTPDPAAPAGPAPEPVMPPIAPVEPVTPAAPETPAAPAPEPVVTIPEPVVPAPEPVAPVTPVAPVVPSGLSSAPSAEPGVPVPTEVAPIIDTVPLKPAEPVPGSIGSAVSMPAEGSAGTDTIENIFTAAESNTPSVPFNDPAVDTNAAATAIAPAKKSSKGTLIALIAVAAVVVIALAVVLVMQLTSDNGGSSSNSGGNSGDSGASETSNNTPDEESSDEEESNSDITSLTCSRNLTSDELLAKGEGTVSGSIVINAMFNNDELSTIEVTKATTIQTEGGEIDDDTINYDYKGTTVDDLNATNAADYYLAPNLTDTSINNLRITYEGLAFTCILL